MSRKNLLSYFASVVMMLAMLVSGCSDGGGGGSSSGIGTTGGTVSMNGVSMVIPQGAVDPELTVSPVITTEDTPPAPAPAGGIIASKTIIIAGLTYNFYEPVKVTMPYVTTNLGTDDVPAVFFYDEGTKSYSLVGVKDVDTTAKTITFSTVHGGKYVAIGIKGLAADLGFTGNVAVPKSSMAKTVADAAVDTGFAPDMDGFFHPNFGAYDSPGGSCLGMANFSVWYYTITKANNSNTGLFTMYKENDMTRWQDDLIVRELISRAFMASSQSWAKSWMQTEYKLDPQWTGYFMILGLKISGPMTFLMADQWPGMKSGHAAVVYKYNAGQFAVYDDNFPGEIVTIDWGKDVNGVFQFTNYTKNAAYNPQFAQFSFEGFATFAETSQYSQLFEGAQTGWCSSNSKFNTLTVTSAVDSQNKALTIAADGSVELTQQDTVTIQGTVTGGIKTANYIIYRLNGGERVRTNIAGGAFSIKLPITLGTNTLMMVATDDKFNEWNAYGGFKEVPIKIKGQLFFENAGFESLTAFDKWLVETHTWQDPTPGSFTPGKSEIATAGMDPIATTINMVYVGNQSARINNSDNYYHISSVTQSATVPNAANPQAKFYWAAVLEDPQHDAANQPYVDVTVTDETAGTTLYSKHFYTNDPSYPGWLEFSSGNWKAIPWQTITLGFTKAEAGHKITVTVTAADCGYGGHGGYLYLDGDE